MAAAQSGDAPDRVPETYGVIHLSCAQDGDIYGVTQKDVFKIDVSTGCIHYLDAPTISYLYQIVEGEAGVFYIGARGHLLEYRFAGHTPLPVRRASRRRAIDGCP